MTQKQNIKAWTCMALLGATLFSGVWAAPSVSASSLAPENQVASATTGLRTITVTGKGEITVQPDIAYIQLGLQTTGKTAQEAQEKNAKQFKSIRNALNVMQVAAKDIQTVRYTTSPDYTWENNKQKFLGYQAEQIIQIKYRDLSKVGALIDTATAAGANRIESVSFSVEDTEKYKLEATDAAIDNARLKAERIAKRAGVKIKEIIQINDGTAPDPILYTQPLMGSMADAKAEKSSQVYPGELKLQNTVTIVFSY
jgi:uncharacterized protein YggE